MKTTTHHTGHPASTLTTTSVPARTGRVAVTAATLVLALVGLVACSSTGNDTASDSRTSSAQGIGAKWGHCMREAGYDVPDPDDALVASGTVLTPQGVDEDQYAADADECSTRLGVQRSDSADQDKWTREYAQVASCIREEYPDYPEQEPGVLGMSPDDYPRATEEAFQHRADECLRKYSPDTRQQRS